MTWQTGREAESRFEDKRNNTLSVSLSGAKKTLKIIILLLSCTNPSMLLSSLCYRRYVNLNVALHKKRNARILLQIGNEWIYWLDRTSQGNGQGENITAVFCFEWRGN